MQTLRRSRMTWVEVDSLCTREAVHEDVICAMAHPQASSSEASKVFISATARISPDKWNEKGALEETEA